MSEKTPPPEFDRDDQLQQLLDNCRFLAFRLDRALSGPIDAIEIEDVLGADMADYRLDGEMVTVIAEYPEDTREDLAVITIGGVPQRDAEGQWHATGTFYRLRSDVEEEMLRRPEDLEIKVEQIDIYDELDDLILPEYYEEIEEEYEAQILARRNSIEGLAPNEVPTADDIENYWTALDTILSGIFEEGTFEETILEGSVSPGVLSAVAERALEKLSDGERLRPYAVAYEQRLADRQVRARQNEETRAALGLDVVGDEELCTLGYKIGRLAADPDNYNLDQD